MILDTFSLTLMRGTIRPSFSTAASLYTLFDPDHIWKKKTISNYRAVPLQQPLFQNGVCVYQSPSIEDIRSYCLKQIDTLWDEVPRFENPHRYYVDLSQALWDEKERLLAEYSL